MFRFGFSSASFEYANIGRIVSNIDTGIEFNINSASIRKRIK